jgi:excisionase family DNA binding protein
MPQAPFMENMPDVMTVRQVAKVLQIGKNQAYEMVAQGEIPSKKYGKSIRVYKQALIKSLNGGESDALVIQDQQNQAKEG